MSEKSKRPLPALAPWLRTTIKIVIDGVAALTAFALAIVLQQGTLHLTLTPFVIEMLVFSLFSMAVFAVFRVHRAIWKYVSLADLKRIIAASMAVIVIYFGLREWLYDDLNLPHFRFSQPVITGMTLVCGLAAVRIIGRSILSSRPLPLIYGAERGQGRVPVLIIGAGDAAENFIRITRANPETPYSILGILDPRADRQKRTIHGIRVLGRPDALHQIVEHLKIKPQRLVFTTTDDTRHIPLDVLMAEADRLGLSLSRLPNTAELKLTDSTSTQLRPVAIEDLLGRPQTAIDREIIRTLIAGRRILITGAGGSIGQELSRQVAACAPAHLVLLDSSEFNLYSINNDIERFDPGLSFAAHVADIRDRRRIARIMRETKPDIVFHAAALKHVPLVEMNPSEGILTNVIGTRNVADAARDAGASAFVQISTDKAVNPTNIMGASKRIGEYYAQSLDLAGGGTRFLTVRFGNVLNSSGSVVPLFKRQIEQGGPVTITHPEITRYFMMISEAVGLVLQSSAFALRASETERGRIFVLDMKDPLRIIDVARQMIRLSGLVPDKDIAIKIVGLRPGEKMTEELFDHSETRIDTGMPSTLSAQCRPIEREVIVSAIDRLEMLAIEGDIEGIRACLAELVPGYAPAPSKIARSA